MGRTPFMSQSFKMRAALPLLAALALPLGACQTGAENRSMDSVHQPVVSRTDYVFDVRPNASGELSSGEMERLAGWFSSNGLAYGDRVSINNPDSYATAGVRDDAARLLGNIGMLLSAVAPVPAVSVPGGTVRSVVRRVVARGQGG